MSALTAAFAETLSNHILRQATLDARYHIHWVGLFTASPGEAGSTANEADYNGYARVLMGATPANNWSAASSVSTGARSHNLLNIEFPVFAAGGGTDEVTVTHWAIFAGQSGTPTAASSGDMMFYGALDDPKDLNLGDSVRFLGGVGSGDLELEWQ